MLKEIQVSNSNNLKLNYMLSLIGANNGSSASSKRKLADLSEVDEKECDDDDDAEVEAENNNENVHDDYDEKDSHTSSPSNNNEYNQKNYESYGGFEDEDESIMMHKLLGKSGSDESNKVVVLRKIKRIQQQKNGNGRLLYFQVLLLENFFILFFVNKRM
jgi:hypothetical protein